MKKTVLIFVIAVLVIISFIVLGVTTHFTWTVSEVLMVVGVLVLVGFAVFIGIQRLRSHMTGEPADDEFSKKVMVKASSVSYFVSIYLWLAIGFFSDKTSLPAHTLIGSGIIAMAFTFFLSWLGIKLFGMKNG